MGRWRYRRTATRSPLGGSKQRALLASLLLHANEVVSRDPLIDELWGVRASSRPSRTGANWPTPDGAFKEPCGDLGGASAQLALNLLCIVTAVVATLSLQRAFFRAPASP